MIIAIPRELTIGETRVSATPETVKKYVQLGLLVRVEKGAGNAAGFSDEEYAAAGAIIYDTQKALYTHANIILKIRAPLIEEERYLVSGQVVVANFQALFRPERIRKFASKGLICMALDMLPRVSRAQSMDILSSQSNLAGYMAVIEAIGNLTKSVPLMMTAAGTLPAAKVLVLGAGVAGLQAVATAKRLGAQVSVFDVRAQVREQVESLGAKFIDVVEEANFETDGGYASETSSEYQERQSQAIFGQLETADVVITTALIPDKKAPVLIKASMLSSLSKNVVIVDLAAAKGGNVEGTVDGQTIRIGRAQIIGASNLPSRIPLSASKLFANNIYNFLAFQYHKDSRQIIFNYDDELVNKVCVTKDGKVFL